MTALITFALWLAANVAFVGFLVWRGYCRSNRELRKWKRRAKRTHDFYSALRRASRAH